MTVGIKQENIITEVGPEGILQALFSTVSSNLEPNGWGSRYPKLLNQLYQGTLIEADCKEAKSEIEDIIKELKSLPVTKLVWDIENLNLAPPKEYDDLCNKKSLHSYFRTITERNLPDEILDNIEASIAYGGNVEIISYGHISET